MRFILLSVVLLDVSIQFDRLRPNEIKLTKIFSGKTEFIVAATVTHDAKLLIAGRRDGSIQVFDLDTGAEKVTLTAHTSYIYQLLMSPDGSNIISVSFDGTVKLWDAKTLKEAKTISTESPCYTATFRGDYLAISCREKIIIYDTKSFKPVSTITQDPSNPAFGISLVGDSIWVTGADGQIRIHDVKSAKMLKSMSGHDSYIVSLDSYAGFTVTAGLDKKIKLWQGQVVKEIESTLDLIYSVKFSKAGRYIAVSGIGGVEIYDRSNGSRIKKLETSCGIPYISLASNEGLIVGVGADNNIRIFDRGKIEATEPKTKRKAGLFGINPSGHEEGVQITSIIKDSQAEKLGAKAGGIITEVDGKNRKLEELIDYITKQRFEGDELYLRIKYDQDQVVYKIRLGANQQQPQEE